MQFKLVLTRVFFFLSKITTGKPEILSKSTKAELRSLPVGEKAIYQLDKQLGKQTHDSVEDVLSCSQGVLSVPGVQARILMYSSSESLLCES